MNLRGYRGGGGCRCPSSGIDLPSASLWGEPAARLRRARDRLHVAENSCGGASAPSPRAAPRYRGSFVPLYTTMEPRNFQLPAADPSASNGALSLVPAAPHPSALQPQPPPPVAGVEEADHRADQEAAGPGVGVP